MTAYRTGAPLCPTCGEALAAHTLDSPAAEVDVCRRCGGVWLDWEDGDFTSLARGLPPAGARVLPSNGPGECPRCRGPLKVEVFQGAAEVLRCGECAGAFVPYPSIGKIAAGTPADAREPSGDDPPVSASAPEDGGSRAWARDVWQSLPRAAAAVRAWLAGR